MSSTNSDESQPLIMPVVNDESDSETIKKGTEYNGTEYNRIICEEDEITTETISDSENNKTTSDEDSESDIDVDPSLIHVVCVDDEPMFYCSTVFMAKDKMHQFANRLINGMICRNTYNISDLYIRQNIVSKDEIHIVSQYKFFLVSYDKIIHRLKMYSIPSR